MHGIDLEEPDFAPTAEQIERKARSEALLRAADVGINPSLPYVESDAEVRVPTAAVVAGRLLALTIVAVKGEGLEHERVVEIIEDWGAGPFFTPKERAFVEDPTPSQFQRIQFTWRYEAAWVLFWALHLTRDPLGMPVAICDVPMLVSTVRDSDNLAAHGLRDVAEILDEADLIYRCHWAVRNATINEDTPTGNLEGGVTMERHYALNWLIGHGDTWDDVQTDT